MVADDLIIDVYHEILMNEIGVMRGNTPIISGVRAGDAIYYFTGFIGKAVTSTPRRGLDFSLLAYAVVNGLRRRYCGYDPTRPSYWRQRDKCSCIKAIYDGIQKDLGRRPTGLKELLVEVITALMGLGLLKPIPRKGVEEDTVTPMKYLPVTAGKAAIKDNVDLNSLALASLLTDYFRANCTDLGRWDISEVLDAEKEILRRAGILGIVEGGTSVYYKTAHGELLRALANASSLPGHPANFEARVLPFLAEPPPPKAESAAFQRIPVDALMDPLTKFFQGYGIGQARDVAEAVINGLKKAGYTNLNPYQASYLIQALEKGLKNALIALTSPTGSGKTLVFTLIAITAAIAGKLSGRPERTIITYPRKSLAREQLQRLIDLVNHINNELAALSKRLGLKTVPRVTIAIRDGDSLRKAVANQAEPLREIKIEGPSGTKLALCHGIDDKGRYFVDARAGGCSGNTVGSIDWVIDAKESVKVRIGARTTTVRPLRNLGAVDIVITNNSMLSKLGFDILSGNRPEWVVWLSRLRLLVIDEAHVFMDPAELERMFLTITRLFWAIAGRGGAGNIGNYAMRAGISVIVSSATLTESKLFRTGPGRIHPQNIVGVLRSPACSNTHDNPPSEVTEFIEKLLGKALYSVLGPNIIYKDYYTAVTCLSKRQGSNALRGLIKLNVYAVTLPSPDRNSWTSLAESMVAVLHWINALRTQAGLEKAMAMVFIDNKETQRHILRLFARRQVLDAVDHADRVLMSVMYERSIINPTQQRDGYRIIWQDEIASQAGRSLFEVAWDIGRPVRVLSTFHALGIYHSTATLSKMVNLRIVSDPAKMSSSLAKSFPRITRFVEGLIRYANIFLGRSGTSRPVDTIRHALSNGVPVGFVMHNADLPREQRLELENHIRNGVPFLVMTTSTLEVGIDIPHAVVVLQYASTPTTAELIQRFGRSGRDKESLYTTTGILVLRNTGEDVQYLSDEDAVRYVFGLKFPDLPSVEGNVEALVRNVVSVIINSGISANPAVVGNMVNSYLQFLGINNANTLWEAQVLASDAMNSAATMRTALAQARSVNDCDQARQALSQAISNLKASFNLYMDNNPALTRTPDGREAIKLMRDFINSALSAPISPQDNLSLALYVREELSRVVNELRVLARGMPAQAANQVMQVLQSADRLLAALARAVTVCVQAHVLSSQARSKKKLGDSFIYLLIRPGIIDKLGNLAEAYALIRYGVGKQGVPSVSIESLDSLLRKVTPAKHKGG